jgi:hypothetical protein
MTESEWNSRICDLTMKYKSGTITHYSGKVSSVRERAKKAIKRNGITWIKVSIPKPETNTFVICTWDRDSKWSRTEVRMPHGAS